MMFVKLQTWRSGGETNYLFHFIEFNVFDVAHRISYGVVFNAEPNFFEKKLYCNTFFVITNFSSCKMHGSI